MNIWIGVMYILMHFADGVNLVLYRPAYQSSTRYSHAVASVAVDGITDNYLCSHTGHDYHSWWKVQLACPVWVTHVDIANRQEAGKQIIIIYMLPFTSQSQANMSEFWPNPGWIWFVW